MLYNDELARKKMAEDDSSVIKPHFLFNRTRRKSQRDPKAKRCENDNVSGLTNETLTRGLQCNSLLGSLAECVAYYVYGDLFCRNNSPPLQPAVLSSLSSDYIPNI